MLPIDQFLKFTSENQLFTKREKILLAVSGGKDSVLMANFFHKSQIPFAIAHCNFQLRGEESERDEQFVKALAKQLNVEFYSQRFDTNQIAKKQKVSIQEAARYLRYAWFNEICRNKNFDAIATAHHQNDVAETLLFNLARGSGLGGLHGILPKKGNIIRPMLFLTAQDIALLIESEQIAFVEDSSNALAKYSRNYLRKNAVPALEKTNKKAIKHIAHTAQWVAQYECLIQDLLKQQLPNWQKRDENGDLLIFAKKIKNHTYAKVLAYELLKEYGFGQTQCSQLLEKRHQSGAQFFSESHRIVVDRELWRVSLYAELPEWSLELSPKNNEVELFGKKIHLYFSDEVSISYDKNKVHLDASLICFPLKVRSWRNGDKIKPLGMNGMKKISDIFIDNKIPLSEKNKVPIITDANGKIIWIVQKTIHEDFKISRNTKKILILELQ